MIRNLFLRILNNKAFKWLILLIDLSLILFTFSIVYCIHFNFNISNLIFQIPFILLTGLTSLLIVGSYKCNFRSNGFQEALNIFIVSSLLFILLFVIEWFNTSHKFLDVFDIPKLIIIIHYVIVTLVLVLRVFIFNALFRLSLTKLDSVQNILIYGTGHSGIMVLNTLKRDKKINYNVIGFIDDNKGEINKNIKFFNSKEVNKKIIDDNAVDQVIIAINNITPKRLLSIVDQFIKLEVEVKIAPTLSKRLDEDLKLSQIRKIKIEDLLDRVPILIDNPVIQKEVSDKVMLVSGAAGSVGSEIARQLALYNCELIVLIDQAESSLYNLQQELIQKGITNFVVIVSDVGDQIRLERIFKQYKPHIVFHAAAYKHVPLMESFPYEAIKVNVLGTKNIVDLSSKYQVERFVMISTDKAVKPTNVMGASKRIAELYIGCINKICKNTKFTITRFGNVLESNGSVIPLFRRQIEEGGPLTVTDKNISRYFMTITEACSLVLEAGTMGCGGEIYIFDMGKSIKLYEIAKKMIYLSGLRYPEDIDIKITGLRPGEKLYEELLAEGESMTKTWHNKIMIAKTHDLDNIIVKLTIDNLSKNFHKLDNIKLVKLMKELVPEYISNNSEFEILDRSFNKVDIK